MFKACLFYICKLFDRLSMCLLHLMINIDKQLLRTTVPKIPCTSTPKSDSAWFDFIDGSENFDEINKKNFLYVFSNKMMRFI